MKAHIKKTGLLGMIKLGILGGVLGAGAAGAGAAVAATPQTALLAGGCFWCLEHDMLAVPGVLAAESGYAGGDRPSPTYETYHDVDATYKVPHIEVVQVTYDPARLTYDQLLQAFVRRVDVTDDGGQFCDRGAGYRPAIFAANEAEKVSATAVLKATEAVLGQPVKVAILPGAKFWRAEDYHQDYANKNPTRYKFYRWNCGRDQRLKALWGGK
jgi:peptide-methionine (S)-S-oxide reductase